MGQFRPSQQLRRGPRVAPDLALFSAGFAVSAAGSFLVFDLVAAAALRGVPLAWRSAAALLGVGVLVGLEWRRLRGRTCSLGLRRQTPRHLGRAPAGVLLWGLDTGVPLTTVRATMLPLAGVLLCALGLGGRWVGLAYALGFLLPLWLLCFVPRPAGAAPLPDLDWVSGLLMRATPHARVAAVALSGVGALALAGLAW